MFFNFSPVKYDEPLFRPPSEAYSLIIQVTLGCSWNRCAFCEMYSTKSFRARKEEDIFKDIETMSKYDLDSRKVFLADGNPMVLSFDRLKRILDKVTSTFPKTRSISTYALPKDISAKSPDELKILKESGLKQLYIGIESGDDEVLNLVNKGETYESTRDGLLKAKEAGMKLSVIILNGLGGKKYSRQHAINSAKLLNEIQPEFASSLVLSFPFGEKHYHEKFGGEYIPMDISDLLIEMKDFITETQLSGTIFRSNHASNYLVLEGILGKDKSKLLGNIDFALNHPSLAGLRKEWQRGL